MQSPRILEHSPDPSLHALPLNHRLPVWGQAWGCCPTLSAGRFRGHFPRGAAGNHAREHVWPPPASVAPGTQETTGPRGNLSSTFLGSRRLFPRWPCHFLRAALCPRLITPRGLSKQRLAVSDSERRSGQHVGLASCPASETTAGSRAPVWVWEQGYGHRSETRRRSGVPAGTALCAGPGVLLLACSPPQGDMVRDTRVARPDTGPDLHFPKAVLNSAARSRDPRADNSRPVKRTSRRMTTVPTGDSTHELPGGAARPTGEASGHLLSRDS